MGGKKNWGCQQFKGVMSLPPDPPLSTSSYHLIFNYFCPNIGGNYIIYSFKLLLINSFLKSFPSK